MINSIITYFRSELEDDADSLSTDELTVEELKEAVKGYLDKDIKEEIFGNEDEKEDKRVYDLDGYMYDGEEDEDEDDLDDLEEEEELDLGKKDEL